MNLKNILKENKNDVAMVADVKRFFRGIVHFVIARSKATKQSTSGHHSSRLPRFLQKLAMTRSTRFTILSALLIVVGLSALTIYLQTNHSAEAAWYNTNWNYRQGVTVTVANNGSDINNLETLLTINTSTLITAGKLQGSCQDLRFTSVTGTQLPYYIDSGCNTTTTKVWVAVDKVPANTTTYTLYMYYGNPSATPGTNPTRFDLFKGLVGYWPMNEATNSWNGTTGEVKDESVNANNGTGSGFSSNSPTASGKYLNAGAFSGSQYVNVGTTQLIGGTNLANDFTISVWALPTTTGGIAFSQGNSTQTNTLFEILPAGTGTGLSFNARNDSGTIFQVTEGASAPNRTNTGFHLYVVSRQGSTINLYVDGSFVKSSSFTPTGTFTFNKVLIGARAFGTPANWFQGSLDETRVYNRTLSPSEITNLYQNPGVLASYPTTDSNPTTSFATEEVGPGPVAYWKFDDGTGTTANDSTSNHNTGTLSGTTLPTWQTEDQCVSGKCLFFNGSTSLMTASANSILQPANVSLSVWVKPQSSASSNQTIISNRTNGSTLASYVLQVVPASNANPNSARLAISTNGSSFNLFLTSTTVLTDGKWHHIEATYTSGNAALYVDGNLQSSSSSVTGGIMYTTDNFRIGGESDGQKYKGFIDEVKIYDYARTSSQVKADYNSRGSVLGSSAQMGASSTSNLSALNNGLVGYWKMDEATWSGTLGEVIDSSGNGNNGQSQGPTNSKAYPGAGKFGNGGAFDGIDNYATLPASSSYEVGNQVTVSLWMKPSAQKSANVFNYTSSGGAIKYVIELGSAGSIQGQLGLSGGSVFVSAPNNTYVAGQWYNVVLTYSSSTGRALLYVNGNLAATAVGSGSINTNSGQPIYVGSGVGTSLFYPGAVDEVRIYNRALSPVDVQNLYNYAPGPVAYYNFDQGSGSTVNDRSGYGNTGTWAGTLGKQWTRGKIGWGGNFNGIDNGINIGSAASLTTMNAASIGTWLYPTTTGGRLFEKDNAGGGAWLAFITSSDQIDFQTTYSSSPGEWSTPTNSIQLNAWNYVEITLDRTNSANVPSIYINGIKQTLTVVQSPSGSLLSDSGHNFIIGNRDTFDRSATGKFDDFRIYNYIISQKQMTQDMLGGRSSVSSGGPNGGSPVGYWKFDEGTGTTANNAGNGGNALNGTLTNMATAPSTSTSGWQESGKFGKALAFDGTNDDVVIGTNKIGPLLNGASGVTLSAWINASSYPSSGGIVTSVIGSGLAGASLNIISNTIQVTGRSQSSDTGQSTTTAVPSLNQWHQVIGELDYAHSTLSIYIDGVLKKTATVTFGSSIYSHTTATGVNDAIGLNNGGGFFNGMIDDVKIYPYILSSSEVQTDYNHNSGVTVGSYANTLTNGLVGYWKLDDGAGSSAVDSSGNGNTGTLTNSPTWTTGKYNGALNFNGTNQYVSATSSTHVDAAPFTASAWFNLSPSATLGSGTKYVLVSKGQDGGGGWGLWITANGAASQVHLSMYVITHQNLTTTLVPGIWYNLVAVQNPTFVQYFLNGTSIGTVNNAMAYNSDASFAFNIGAETGGETFPGQIDDARVYNRALSADEVSQLYNNTQTSQSSSGIYCIPGDSTQCASPVGEWNFDQAAGTTVNDTSTNGNTGTWNGTGKQHWVKGQTGFGGNFNGTDDYANLGNVLNLSTGNFTVSSWIKIAGVGTGSTYFISKWSDNTNTNYRFGITNTRTLVANLATSSTAVSINSSTVLNVGQWYHVVWLWTDGVSFKLYINGVLDTTTTTTNTRNDITTNTLNIGADSSPGAQRYFSGQIDQVRIYNYARTPAQVAWDYNRGGPVGWWRMDECQGNVLNDSSGFGNIGTINIGSLGSQTSLGTCAVSNTASAWSNGAVGKFNSSLNFDGTDDYVDLGNTTSFNALKPSLPLSLSAWINLSSITASSPIISTDGSGTNYYGAWMNVGSGVLQIDYGNGGTQGSGSRQTKIGTTTLVVHKWYHVVGVIRGPTDMSLYINGVDDKGTYSGTGGSLAYSTNSSKIGKFLAATPSFFPGQIDDVRVYNYALTPLQVQLLYNNNAAFNVGPVSGNP